MKPAFTTAVVFLAFALLHSVGVSSNFKLFMARVTGEKWMRAYYRLSYTVFAIVTAAIAIFVIVLQPDIPIYRPPLLIRWLMHGVQFLSLVIFYLGFRPFDMGYFTGVKQAVSYLKTKQVSGDIEGMKTCGLITTGVYGLVRHPMYLAGILLFAFEPYFTVKSIILRVLAISYFIWGGFIEERRFIKDFDGTYQKYRQDVPMFNILRGIAARRR
ncbi:MAG: NnrU family protein [Syntrophales bacterium]